MSPADLPVNSQQAVERLQSTLGKMEAALASILDCIVWTDRNGHVQWCNVLFDQLVDRSHMEILGGDILQMLVLKQGGLSVINENHPFHIVLNGHTPFTSEYDYRKHTGLELKLNIYTARININVHGDESIIFVISDITDKKIAQDNEKKLLEEKTRLLTERAKTEELEKIYLASLNILSDLDREKRKLQSEIKERERIEERLQQLLVSVEQSPDSIMITDINGIIQYVNPRFFELTGFEEKDVLGTMAKVMQLGLLEEEIHKQLWEHLRRGKVWKGEFENIKKDGNHYWEHMIISPIHDKMGQVTNFLVIIQDITERKAAEAKMKAAIEMKAEFTSTVSHELRTPLASIKGAIDIIMSETAGPLTANQTKFLGKAKLNIDRLKRLIDDFLDLSKLEAGKMSMDVKFHDVTFIVNDVIEMQMNVAQKKGLIIRSEFAGNIPKVPCDADKISQVLLNFINNAIKFTEKGEVIVSVLHERDMDYIEFCISDTGEGIRKEDLSKVFEKFKQVGDPAKRKTGGTGLGLAICREIVDQHKGRIWAESEVGKGSQFYFILPIEHRRD